MKYVLTCFVWLPLLAGCQAAAPNARPASSSGESASASPGTSAPRAILHVEGMSCPLCATNIDKQLMGVRGVEDVTINLGTGEVKAALALTNPPTRDQLAAAIERAGFTLTRIEMPEDAKGGTP